MSLPYYLILAFVFIVSLSDFSKKSKNTFIFISIVLTLFSGLREWSIYLDMDEYEIFFRTLGRYSNEEKGLDYGYYILNIIVHSFTDNFYIFSFVVSCLIVGGYCWFALKYSPMPSISLFVFTLVSLCTSLFLIRQYLAIVLGMIAFHYIINKKQKYFLLCCIAACLFHKSSVILFPMYYLYWIPNTKRNMFLLFAGLIGFTFLFKMLAMWMFSGYEYYQHYLNAENEFALQRTIMKVYILCLFILALGKQCLVKNINFLVLLCLIMNVIIYVGGDGIYGAFRMRMYFEISEIIGIPLLFYYIRKKSKFARISIFSMTLVYLIALYVSFANFVEGDNLEHGYRTLFSS